MQDEKEIYEIIKHLKSKKIRLEIPSDEKSYKMYYITACMVGVISDERYPRFCNIRKFLRIKEFHQKDMWHRGNQQSLTYRTNRVRENLNKILRKFRKANIADSLYKVYDSSCWEPLGFVKGRSSTEANQLASLLYSVSGKQVRIEDTHRPVWSSDPNDLFIKSMTAQISTYNRKISTLKERIIDDQKIIDDYKKKIEFLILNLGAFSNE